MINYSFVERKYFPHMFSMILATFFILPAFFLPGVAGDTLFHVPWSNAYAEEFWKGNFLPGWVNSINAGCGSPDLIFYTVFPYLVSSLFEVFDFDGTGWFPLVLTGWSFLSVAGYGSFLLFRLFTRSNSPALLGASVYIFSPFFILVFYQNFLFSFFVSMAIGPLLIVFAVGIARRQSRSIFAFALVLGGLICTNISGTILFGSLAFGLAFAVTLLSDKKFITLVLRFGFATLLGFALSSFYLFPVVSLIDGTAYSTSVYKETLSYYNNFLGFGDGGSAGKGKLAMSSAVMTIVLYVFCFLAFLCALQLKGIKDKLWIFWLMVIVVAGVLTHSISHVVWEHVFFLQMIQFPLRIMAIVNIAFAVLIVYWLNEKLKSKPENDVIPMFGILFFVFGVAPAALLFENAFNKELVDAEYRTKAMEKRVIKFNFFLEKDITAINDYMENEQLDFVIEQCKNPARLHNEKEGSVEVVESKNRYIKAKVRLSETQQLTFSQLYHRWWKVYIDGEEVDVTHVPPLGQVAVLVPKGEHDVVLAMPRTAIENWGKVFTLITFLIIILGIIRYRSVGQ